VENKSETENGNGTDASGVDQEKNEKTSHMMTSTHDGESRDEPSSSMKRRDSTKERILRDD